MNYTVKLFPGDRVITGKGYISNGHWAVRPENCCNASLFTSEATIGAAFPKSTYSPARSQWSPFTYKKDEPLTTYQATRWIVEAGGIECRVFKAKDGQYASFNRKYLKMLKLDAEYSTLYGLDEKTQFGDEPFQDTFGLCRVELKHETPP